MTSPPVPGLVSVIVPCSSRLRATRRGLAALLRHTRRPWELVAVARADNPATAAYLAGIGDAAPARVEVVDARTGPRGTRDAWPLGLRAARGEYVAPLGRTAVVTDGWLDQLIALADADPAIGMVAPMGNIALPPSGPRGPPIPGPTTAWTNSRRGGGPDASVDGSRPRPWPGPACS